MNIRLTPVVQNLIILNVIIYIGLAILPPHIAHDYFTLHKTNTFGWYKTFTHRGDTYMVDRNSPFDADIMDYMKEAYPVRYEQYIQQGPKQGEFKPLQIVTSFFYHDRDNLLHIVFNMFVLASLGPLIEMVLGSPRFLKFYLFCGVVSGLLLAYFDPSPANVVGASTAISGVLVAFAMYFPKQKLQFLFIPFGFEARKFVIGVGIFSAVMVVLQVLNVTDGGYISHFGHLVGMIAALIFFYLEKHVPFLKS